MTADLIEKLTTGEEDERIFAAEDLGFSDDPSAAMPLLQALEVEQSRGVRLAIGRALSQLHEPSTAERALALLRSDDAFVRNQAVDLLRSKGADALPILTELSRDSDSDVRKFCLDVLAETHSEQAAEIYARALSDEDLNVSITALENIGRFRMKVMEPAVLGAATESKDPMVVSAALTALAQIASDHSLPRLRASFAPLESQPEFLLVPLLQTIAKRGTTEDIPALRSILDRGKAKTCNAALEALAKILKRNGTEGVDSESLLSRLQPHTSGIAVCDSTLVAAVQRMLPSAENALELHSLAKRVE